jgi:protein-disulfide isomerase
MTLPNLSRILVAGCLAMAAVASARAEDKSTAFTPGQEQAIRKIVRDYLIKNPEVIAEAIAALRKKQEDAKSAKQAEAVAAHRKEIFTPILTPVGGNPDGTITVVEFFDYNCGWCKRAKPILDGLIKEDGNIRVIYKEFPILGAASVYAAQAALAAEKQGKYEVFHDKMMAFEGRISPPVVLRLAKEVGLDVDRLQKDMKDPEITKALRATYELAQKIGVEGTPAFVIGTRVAHFMQPDQFAAALEDARRTCKAENIAPC